ncbi:uncharacterized protein UV8b_06404 [Ustilaginoidea virens]|uniref:Guanylate kinase-like domain-containing protein n=1 Tax=Ustilaginoidea virens TaxID=1159556 RepID=A0A8E5HVN3_USTVR|nr:uncharacterized protein UV8b_06404 [Ustilaginoidea virens]QUC22163.1 hypothetical protein UV8b_06404 [Ustilaginoidea virens]
MPALAMENPGVSAVARFSSLLDELLAEAAKAKPTPTIEPALKKSNLDDISGRISASISNVGGTANCQEPSNQQFAIIETAARDLFDSLIATIPIKSPDFVKMWNFLDILSILSDDGQCDPALLFWLVEELLDSQTILGCRIVFDYLESRRERITAKHFKQKHLVILRSCNELLRRLSRAEDTAFCGRVFIFLFQSFPLGDRSSVNLRGEYHVENVTTFEFSAAKGVQQGESMDIDASAEIPKSSADTKGAKEVTFDSKDSQPSFDPEALYPLFWSLQESFSQPLRLFDARQFTHFKRSLDATMKAFHAIHQSEGSSKSLLESSRRNLKRKREGREGYDFEDAPQAFNPKYLTSMDLFELEICDLSFRRHVLVQALIVMDFLLSLSAGAKEKAAGMNASNKSVIYSDELSEENAKWATEMKSTISDYLKRGIDGAYFYRMVETVLTRDKNWVFWKMASCPPIQRDPVTASLFNQARASAQKSATNKRLRPTPIGSVSLDFLNGEEDEMNLDQLESAERYQLPELGSFQRKLADDDFEIEMPASDQTKVAAVAGKASKSWRALRIAARLRLAAFDKIDDPKKVNAIFEEPDEEDQQGEEAEQVAPEGDMPEDRSAVVLSGPRAAGKSALVKQLLNQHKGVFAPVVRHTTRKPLDGEVKGKSFHFVSAQEFNQLRDGDRLIEHGIRDDGTAYGTSWKAVDAVLDSGRVPIIELDMKAARFAKDMDFSARYILVQPPPYEALQARLSAAGLGRETIQGLLAMSVEETEEIDDTGLFDHTIANDDDEEAVARSLSAYIFSKTHDTT